MAFEDAFRPPAARRIDARAAYPESCTAASRSHLWSASTDERRAHRARLYTFDFLGCRRVGASDVPL